MSAIATGPGVEALYTPEDLLAMPDAKGFELIDGRLVKRNVGAESSWIGGLIFHLVLGHCRADRLGWAWPAEAGFRCFPRSPGRVRKPNVAFVRFGRLPGEVLPRGFVTIPPDLAVEVLSPNDLAAELIDKLEDYHSAGVPLVWVVDPGTRTVAVFRADGTAARLREGDELSGEAVLPGFRAPVASLFPPRPAPVA